MAVIISGYIFEDDARSGGFNVDDNVIGGVYVLLKAPNDTVFQYTISSASTTSTINMGQYQFTNLTTAGTYEVYETVSLPTDLSRSEEHTTDSSHITRSRMPSSS